MRKIFGTRGTILIVLGFLWMLKGIGILSSPGPPDYPIFDHLVPWQGVLWIVTGAVAMSFSRQDQGYDSIGFLSLYILPAITTVMYFYSWLNWAFDLPILRGDGNPRGIIGVASWLAITYVIFVCSEMREDKTIVE